MLSVRTIFLLLVINIKSELKSREGSTSTFHSFLMFLNIFKNKLMASESGLNGLYRPRSALARALYEKQRNDRLLEAIDQNEWYQVDKSKLSDEMREKFVQLGPDEETRTFIASSTEKSSWIWTQIWHLLAKAVLKHFWSITDINGWLRRGSMFVLSEAQWSMLMGSVSSAPNGDSAAALLDLGAGDGAVTARFARRFTRAYATEMSAAMRETLAARGFIVLDAERWSECGLRFSCVCALNVLDRCARPVDLLRRAAAALAPGGRLVIAIVLPYSPYVEGSADHSPQERLPLEGATFEAQAARVAAWARREAGLRLAAWTRAPYLCEGDLAQAYYWLEDAIFVFTLPS